MKNIYRIFMLLITIVVFIACMFFKMWKRTPDVFERGDVSLFINDCITIPSADKKALLLLTDYFSLRCGSFARAARIKDSSSYMDNNISISKQVLDNEAHRIRQLRKLQKTWKCHFSGASADVRIDGWKDNGDVIVCLLYEFIWFNNWYQGYTSPDTADLSGYSVYHAIHLKRVEQKEQGFIIQIDDYDEGRPTYAATNERLYNDDYIAYAGVPNEAQPICRKKAPAFSINRANFIPYFKLRDAVTYADRWTADHNLENYPNLEPLGGDCCNFASQCLYAGDLPLTQTWYHNGVNTGSPAWISSSKFYAALTGASGNSAVGRGVAVLRMDDKAGRYVRLGGKRIHAADIFYPGSPVFYRWNGGFAQDELWNHTALCVGTMGDGAPAVSCHTADKYHIKWNYGGKVCDYGTVQLTPTAR